MYVFRRIVEIKEKLGENNDINFANTLSDLADLHYLNVRD